MLYLAQATTRERKKNLSLGEFVSIVFSACFEHQCIDYAVISQHTETGKRSIRSSKSMPGADPALPERL
jgi:hypothetical protein